VILFKKEDILNKITKEWGRIYIYTEKINQAIFVLKKIFGVYSISPCYITDSNLDNISKKALEVSKNFLNKNTSFAIRSSRTGSHEFSSQDIAIRVGNDIVKAFGSTVDLTNPDIELFIETREDQSYIFTEKIDCVAGMPLGAQGKILAYMENQNSVLAAFYLIRRGCKVVFLYTDDQLKKVIEKFNKSWYLNSKIFKLNESKNNYKEINSLCKKYFCDVVVTSHKIDKNIDEIVEFKQNIDVPVLHPVVALEDKEINQRLKDLELNK
jgi:thiamine biosynthesis protein ThiI